jgi:hypothetical protein
MGTWLLAALDITVAAALFGRCRAGIAAARTRVRTTAQVADVFGRARTRWDAGTAAMADALVPLLTRPPGRPGFGDAEIEAELLARALSAPDALEESDR